MKIYSAKIFSILVITFCFSNCKTAVYKSSNMDEVVQIAVDSSINGKNFKGYFYIDFVNASIFDAAIKQKFLTKNKNFTQINSDSLLAKDSIWLKYGILDKLLIRFKNVEMKNDTLIINVDNIKATDGSFGTKVRFIRDDTKYKFFDFRRTWIS